MSGEATPTVIQVTAQPRVTQVTVNRPVAQVIRSGRGPQGVAGSGGTAELTVGLFANLGGLNIPIGTDVIQTDGYAQTGLGGARYVVTASTTATAYRKRSLNGRWFELAADQDVTPAMFGAPIDGVTNDVPAIQAAVDWNETVRGRGMIFLQHYSYHCSAGKITVDPTLTSLCGWGAQLDFSDKVTSDPDAQPELLVGGDFASSSGWIAGTLATSRVEWTISSGTAVHETTGSHYGDFGRQVPGLAAGDIALVTFVVDSISAEADQDYLTVALQTGHGAPTSNKIGYGSGPGKTVNDPGTYTVQFPLPLTNVEAGGPYLNVKSNNDVVMSSASVRLYPDNTALLVRVRPDSQQYGHAPFEISGIELIGDGRDNYGVGIELSTLPSLLSSRTTLRDLSIHGFNSNLKISSRGYGIKGFSIDSYDANYALETVDSATEAGEEISFHSCFWFNSHVAIQNPGNYELRFFGGSFDYCGQVLGAGGIEAHSCHFEFNRPTVSTKYPFHCSGQLYINGGYILIAGEPDDTPLYDHLFYTDTKFSRIRLKNVGAYNWHTATDALHGGLGRFESEGIAGPGNKQVAQATTRTDDANLFGPGGRFEATDSSIQIMTWITSGSTNTVRTDRYNLSWSDTPGSSASVGISATNPYEGTKSIRCNKIGVGTAKGLRWWLAAPVKPRQAVNMEYYMRTEPTVSGGTAALNLAGYFLQVLGADADGIPISGATQFFGETNVNVDLTGPTDWTYRRLLTTYSDASSPNDGYAPEWATHCLLRIDMGQMPAGMVLRLDALAAWVF